MKRIIAVVFPLAVFGLILAVPWLVAPKETDDETDQSKQALDLTMPQPAGFGIPDYVKGAMIVVGHASELRPDISRSKEAAENLAIDIRQQIVSGKITFSEAAKKFSNAPSQKKGGDLGFLTREQVGNMPGAVILFTMKPGDISSVIQGQGGFFIYHSVPYEPQYFKGIFIRYSRKNDDKDLRSPEEAKKAAHTLFNDIVVDRCSFEEAADQYTDIASGPGGYLGKVIPGSKGSDFEEAVQGLNIGEISPVYDDGRSFIMIKRCAPVQFTFSYIVFSKEDDTGDNAELFKKAEQVLEEIQGKREKFYQHAMQHHHSTGWDSPWYKVSKDLYEHRLAQEIYQFLSAAQPGDISKPLKFTNGMYIIMKEEFIE